MRLLTLHVMALVVVVSGLSFATWSLATRSTHSPWYVAKWEDVGAGLQRIEFVSEDDVNVLVYAFDPALVTLRLETGEESHRVKTWASELKKGAIFINGFYFLEDGSPAGAVISRGVSLSELNFDWDKSGVIQLAPSFKLIDTARDRFSPSVALEAGQSYPFLLKQGVGAILEDTGLTARRTFIGTDEFGTAYVGVVWRDDVTLFQLMNVLQEMDIAWQDVINLDGGPSTGLVVETEGFSEILDSAAPVPNVIVIQPK